MSYSGTMFIPIFMKICLSVKILKKTDPNIEKWKDVVIAENWHCSPIILPF